MTILVSGTSSPGLTGPSNLLRILESASRRTKRRLKQRAQRPALQTADELAAARFASDLVDSSQPSQHEPGPSILPVDRSPSFHGGQTASPLHTQVHNHEPKQGRGAAHREGDRPRTRTSDSTRPLRPSPFKCSPSPRVGSTLLTTMNAIAREDIADTPLRASPEKSWRTPRLHERTHVLLEPAVPSQPMEQWSMQSKKEARTRTLQKLRDVVQEHYGPQYSVHPFGSTCYGAGSWTSDVDVAIYDAERPYGIAPGDNRELPTIYNVSNLGRRLKLCGYQDVKWVRAAVPIVKCRDPETGVSCDVNVNNRLGVYNTALIRQYCLRLPYLAALLRNVKAFIKSVDLNNPAQNDRGQPTSFSSYAITLMTIALLQNKGHAPNLQEDPELIVDTYFWENRFGLHRPLPVRFGRCRKWVRPASSPPMMQSWLQFWGYQFDYAKYAISVRDGGFIERPAVIPREWGHKNGEHNRERGRIAVLDPLTGRNCTFAILPSVLEQFVLECQKELLKWEGR